MMAGHFPSSFFATAYMPGQYWRPVSVVPPIPDSSSSGVGRLQRSGFADLWMEPRSDDDDVIMAVIAAFLEKVR